MSVIRRFRLPLSLFAAAACAAVAMTAAAESPEGAAGGAGAAFEQMMFAPAPHLPPRVVKASFPVQEGQPLLETVVLRAASVAGSATLIKDIDMAALLNRQLKTTLTYTLGGKNVWVSGAFDMSENAYVSILVEGEPAKFFNVKDLLTDPKTLDIGSAKYKLSLSPDLVDQLDSEIVLTNAADRRDKQRIALRDMIAAISATGELVQIGGDAYRCFYYDDVTGGTRSFAFILTDASGEFHIFLVPSKDVPSSGQPAQFKMHDNKAVGLLQSNGKLKVFAL